MLGVRAERVVAHGPAPRGFLIHGGDATLWTAYLNGGALPRGEEFVRSVKEIADRVGVDPSPIEQPRPRDRRSELLNDFFELCCGELASARGSAGRAYLENRGIQPDEVERIGLGVAPDPEQSARALRDKGYSTAEVTRAGLVADPRWAGRILGAWRDERGKVGTLWARTVTDAESSAPRYLYLRGTSRAALPPYGLSEIVATRGTRGDLVLVEGLFDIHQLRSRGIINVAALGGTSARPQTFERLANLGFERVTLCLDGDVAGRTATARAVEQAVRASRSPSVLVVDPDRLKPAKDPDALVRGGGLAAWEKLVATRTCGIAWRALEFTTGIEPSAAPEERRRALARAGMWLGALPQRFALEQEDAVGLVAKRCGYSREAVARSFRARFWRVPEPERLPGRSRIGERTLER